LPDRDQPGLRGPRVASGPPCVWTVDGRPRTPFTFWNTGLTNGVAADVMSATALMDRANGELTQANGLIDPAACN